jgi:transcriptional regulator with XRE-family HTH domain
MLSTDRAESALDSYTVSTQCVIEPLETSDDDVAAMAIEHEGQRLRELLAAVGKSPADLGRACKVSRTAVMRWLNAEQIGKVAWLNVRPGLVTLNIDPRKIKPDDRIADTRDVDLRPLLHGFDHDELLRIKKIAEADDHSREKLIYYLDGHIKALGKLPRRTP